MTEILSNVISYLLGFATAVFAEPIRKWLFKPDLILEFAEGHACITKTYEAVSGEKVADVHTIRVKVTNQRRIVARDCRGYLINVEKQDEKGVFVPTIYCDSLPLAWSCQRKEDRYRGIDIPKGVNQYLDVIVTKSTSNEFEPQVMVKLFRYSDLFKEKGTYRFTIQATVADANPRTIKLILKWKSHWDDFDVYTGDCRQNHMFC
jgi:hypothetical protein